MSILDDILKVKKDEVKKLRSEYSLGSFRDFEFFDHPVLSLKNSLTQSNRLGIITEIKKASPSKGVLIEDFDHIGIANIYLGNQTDSISILTDKNFFRGDIKFLREIAEFKTAPLLRKDFIIDEYQIFEAKANGADAILLIAEALSKNQISELTSAAADCALEVVLEIHSRIQINKIDFSKNNLIGINNRDLETFNVNLGVSRELSEIIPDDVFLVSESGIKCRDDIKEIQKTKIRAVLVGEHFMRSDNIGEELKIFKDWCRYES